MKHSHYLLVAIACAVMFFYRLGSVPLIGFDEGAYATCSSEMTRNGDYLVPTCNGEPFFDKPPLVYWLQAASMSVTGIDSLGARLPSAAAGFAVAMYLVFLGARVYGKNTGLLTGLVWASSPLPITLSRMALLDQVLTLTISLSLGSFLLAYLGLISRRGYLLSWAALGLAVMVKGPAGAVLILAVIGIFLIIRRRIAEVAKCMPFAGILISTAIALPWYVLVQKATGGAFLNEFIIHQNVQRALGQDFAHNQPFWFYLAIFPALFLPWSAFLPLAAIRLSRLRPENHRHEASLFLIIWTAMIIIIFSALKSKLMSYILPAFPAAVLLVGAVWDDVLKSKSVKPLLGYGLAAVVLSLLIGTALVVGPKFLPDPIPGLPTALMTMGASLLIGSIAAAVMLISNRGASAFAALWAGGTGFMLAAIALGLPTAAREMATPVVETARFLKKTACPNQPVYASRLNPAQPALGFYSGIDVKPIKSANEVKDKEEYILVTQQGDTEPIPGDCVKIGQVGRYIIHKRLPPENP